MDEFNENSTKTIFGIGNPLLDIQAKESGFNFSFLTENDLPFA